MCLLKIEWMFYFFFGKNASTLFPNYKIFLLLSFPSYSAHSSVAGQRRSANVEQSGGLFSSLMGETSVTQRWIRGEISNFQYLMALNTLAGRTYRLKISTYIFSTSAVILNMQESNVYKI